MRDVEALAKEPTVIGKGPDSEPSASAAKLDDSSGIINLKKTDFPPFLKDSLTAHLKMYQFKQFLLFLCWLYNLYILFIPPSKILNYPFYKRIPFGRKIRKNRKLNQILYFDSQKLFSWFP